MKKSIYISLAFSLLVSAVNAQTRDYQVDYVASTTATPKNCVEIPSDFADGKVYDKSVLRALQGKEITTVELWYTRYKQKESFDQVKLNNKRISELKEAFPQLKSPNVKWIWKEQTAATTREDASKCFHGFRIFTTTSDPIWENAFRISDEANQTQKITVDAIKGGTFQSKSGSVIHIPPAAVVDANGNPITGNYTIAYTEFRTPAQIAYSGLPMTINDNGSDFAFNSAGMYEINGYQNDQALQLAKPITVDFNCTDQLNDLNFYALDPQTGMWLKREKLAFQPAKPMTQNENTKRVDDQPVDNLMLNVNEAQGEFVETRKIQFMSNGSVTFNTLFGTCWKDYQQLKKEEPDFIKKAVLSDKESDSSVQVKNAYQDEFTTKVFNIGNPNFHFNNIAFNGEPVKDVSVKATLLAEGADAGHTYPNMIKGLNSPKFGVYNCDQQFRMGKTLNLEPSYVDSESGKPIEGLNVLCVINKDVNGSFSFNPKAISVSGLVENELILFTKDNKVYYLNTKEIVANATTGSIRLKMKDVSDQVKNSADLQAFLKL